MLTCWNSGVLMEWRLSPLQALQFIKSKIKDVGHVVVGRPAVGQLVLQPMKERIKNSWSQIQYQASMNKKKLYIWYGVLQKPLGLPLLPFSRTNDRQTCGSQGSYDVETLVKPSRSDHHNSHLFRVALFLLPLPPSFAERSGKSLEGGLGGTLVLSRKMHFLFFISFPHRNLQASEGRLGRFLVQQLARYCSCVALTCSCICLKHPEGAAPSLVGEC